MGDGAMQMNGINVLITVSKYWKEWATPNWICLVLNNRDLNQVTWEERIQSGAAWDEALASDRPVVLEAFTDPTVPPLPPHITLD